MEKFCKSVLIYGLIIIGIISFLLIGFGVLLILNSDLILQVIIRGLASSCILFGTVGIFFILIGILRGLTR